MLGRGGLIGSWYDSIWGCVDITVCAVGEGGSQLRKENVMWLRGRDDSKGDQEPFMCASLRPKKEVAESNMDGSCARWTRKTAEIEKHV
jgi:hypothetical protein